MLVKPKRASLSTPTVTLTPACSLSFFIIFCCVSVSIAQDAANYYFPTQNRFVPSSGAFPRQLQQQPAQSLNGFRSSSGGFSASPASYQEQLLFIANENSQNGNKQTPNAANSPYVAPYGANSQFAKANRPSDYYDISPRPFGVPVNGVGGAISGSTTASASNGFTRSKAIRNGIGSGSSGNSLNGFQPTQTQRVNVPHQQTQFLAHFNEPTASSEKRLPSSNALQRPFGNGGFTPSGSRVRTQAPAVEDATPQAASAYRLRNRFQPSTSTASSATSTTSASSGEVSSKRYNRFGNNRVKSTSSSPSSTTQSAASERPSFGRKPPNPRRPAFISREVNEPLSAVSKRPFNYNSARLKLPRPTPSTTSTTESLEQDDSEDQYEQDSEEQDEELELEEEEKSNENTEEATSLEKLPLQEEAITPVTLTKTEAIQSLEQASNVAEALETATNNEEASGKTSTSSTEETQTAFSAGPEIIEETTLVNSGNDYEYVEDEVRATTAISEANESTEQHQTETDAVTTEPSLEQQSTIAQSVASSKETSETQKNSSSKPDEQPEYDDEAGEEGDEEYEYDEEEVEEHSAATSEESSKQHNDITTETELKPAQSKEQEHEDEREIISVVTTKSVVNGSTAYPAPVTSSSISTTLKDIQPAPQLEEELTEGAGSVFVTTPLPTEEATPNVTESYVVVASIQTSRSINGARFLPFPAIEQEETKQTLSELERKVHSKQQQKQTDQNESSEEPSTTTTSTPPTTTTSTSTTTTTEKPLPAQGASTESIIDKLDRVQSELSSGVLSGKYSIISQMDASTPASTTTTGNGRFVPSIRKFQPRTTAAPSTTSSGSKLKVQHFDESEMDELAGLLPVGFKPKFSYKNRKITTSTTTTTTTTTTEAPAQDLSKKPGRNSTISRSFKNGLVSVQDVGLAGLLPKGYKPLKTTTTTKTPEDSKPIKSGLEDLFSEIKFDDSLAALLPKDYKLKPTTAKPDIAIVDDLSKFLPVDYKSSSTSTTRATSTTQRSPAVAVPFDDLSKFLPPGYKSPKEPAEPKLPVKIIPLQVDDISSLLPPDFKLNETTKVKMPVVSENDDLLASLLPPGYKAKPVHPASTSSKPSAATMPTSTTAAPAAESKGKIVFPKSLHKRLGAHRLTTPHTLTEGADAAPTSPAVVIKKGPPTRATTEFTGWPTPSTTPLSIDKLNAQTINFEDLLTAAGTSSTTSTTTTTTTTTSTTTPRPTKPGHCTADCDLEATIRIIEGVAWKPELLDHNTLEWKNLAHELEAQLNDVYSTAPQLSKWYKKVRIDSFSQGSVLVDYYVELANITQDVDTLEIKQLFHDALSKPTTPVLPDKDALENETDSVSGPQEEHLVKASYQMGKFFIDPVATEFSVIAKNLHTNVEFAEDDLPIPQWAIVVIVIGVGSLVFVVIFGVTVLLNRQKRAKKTPIPLTSDMLNELKVNHMGGADNYGVDDFYNIDDPWNDTKQPIKPKRFTNSMHGSNSSNIYDSWRSTRHPHSSGDYFYDQQPTYSQKGDSLKRPHHHHQPYPAHQQGYGHQYPDAFADAHQMYSYNNHASRTRYARDYDPDF